MIVHGGEGRGHVRLPARVATTKARSFGAHPKGDAAVGTLAANVWPEPRNDVESRVADQLDERRIIISTFENERRSSIYLHFCPYRYATRPCKNGTELLEVHHNYLRVTEPTATHHPT